MTIDAMLNAAIERDLPGLAAALDGEIMRPLIAEALLEPGGTIERCEPGRLRYLPGEACIVRYDVRTAGVDWMVTGRVFGDLATAARYATEQLAPLAERAAEHVAGSPWARLSASIDQLAVAVSAFPVDADLPALAEATDPEVVLELLSESLGERFAACAITPIAYSRQGRCVLRYDLDPGGGGRRRTVYGKLTTGGDGVFSPAVLDGLRAQFADGDDEPVTLPRPLGHVEHLGLLLMGPVGGVREVRVLLQDWADGDEDALAALEDRLSTCAQVGHLMHSSGIALGLPRTIASELEDLRGDLARIARIGPDVSARLAGWLDRAEGLATATQALPTGLAHGDFTVSQFLFNERGAVALLDFDDVCQAEPALDLGQFTAYLKLGGAKRAGDPEQVLPLVRTFVDAYGRASGQDPRALADRHAAHEICAFVRLASNAWHKLKAGRLANVVGALEGASSWQARPGR